MLSFGQQHCLVSAQRALLGSFPSPVRAFRAAAPPHRYRLPPLRERPDDIPELVEHFFVKAKEKHGRPDLVLPPRLLLYFCGYRWPGNIRELENVIERLVVLTRGDEIAATDLPEFLCRERPVLEELRLDLPPQGISLEAVEKELILRALKTFDWNQTQAARYLDLSRKTPAGAAGGQLHPAPVLKPTSSP